MGFDNKFLNAIQAIYSVLKAQFKANGITLKDIHFTKGTQKGCLLSPLLFIILIEPLVEEILQNPEIKGFKSKNNNYKLSLFADNMVLYSVELKASSYAIDHTLNNFDVLDYELTTPKLCFIIGASLKILNLS